MTTRRRIARRPTQARVRPRLTWRRFDSAGDITIVPGAQASVNLVNDGLGPDLANFGILGDYTVRRIRGVISATSALGSESNTTDYVAWGIGVLEADADIANVFPEPLTDPFDWFGYGHVMVSLQGGFTAAIHPMTLIELDVRSMRKVNENHQVLVMVLEAPAGNTGNVVLNIVGRLLVSHGLRTA